MTVARLSARASVGLAALWFAASSQNAFAQANPGPQMGSPHGVSNNLGTGTGDMPGSSVGLPEAKTGELKGAYGLDLSQRIAQAQSLVDQVGNGKVLTDRDTQHIRNLIREDFVAWNKRYDLLPATLRAERDRWLPEPSAFSPNDWAQQRLKWLQAQRSWVLARGG